jgi:hypothetical protein
MELSSRGGGVLRAVLADGRGTLADGFSARQATRRFQQAVENRFPNALTAFHEQRFTREAVFDSP